MRDIPGYRFIRAIDKGGMTNLNVATVGGRDVVLRTIREDQGKKKEVRKSFLHGIKVLQGLDHPSIVELVDHGRHRGIDYMAVEYHENLNLRERIVNEDPQLAAHQLHLLTQLAAAITKVHDAGYLHMDLKPENILIRDDMTLILVDFDLAIKHKDKCQKFKTISGTASYLAPETLGGGLLSELSEIYTFGVCAYELLTFNKPIDAPNPEAYQKMLASGRAKAKDIRSYREDLPAGLVKVVMNCLENNPDDRYPAMRMVLRELKNLK